MQVFQSEIIEPTNPQDKKYEAVLMKGNLAIAQQNFKESIVWYDKAIHMKPEYPDAYLNKGSACLELQKFREAVQCFDKLIKYSKNPKIQAEAHKRRGSALCSLHRYEEGIQAYDKAIQMDQKDPMTFSNKGQALIELGR